MNLNDVLLAKNDEFDYWIDLLIVFYQKSFKEILLNCV